jgi:opacity protein-like surface antigen
MLTKTRAYLIIILLHILLNVLLGAVVLTFVNVAKAENSNYYIKPILGHFSPQKVGAMTSKKTPFIGFAIGYDIADNARIDLSIEHFSNIRHAFYHANLCAQRNSNPLVDDNKICTYGKVTTGKINLFVDLLKIKGNTLYGGLGAGISKTKGVLTKGLDSDVISEKKDLTYAIYLGVNRKLFNNTHLEIGYSYQHLGEYINNYKGHAIMTAIRLNL